MRYGAAMMRCGRDDDDVQFEFFSFQNDMFQLVEFVDNGMIPLRLLLFCLCIANLESSHKLCLMLKKERI